MTTTASRALQRLREAPQQQLALYTQFRKQQKKLRDHPYLEAPQRNAEMVKLVEETRAALGELQTSCIAARQTLQQKANERKVTADDKSTRKVQRALDTGRWSVAELTKQLVAEEDRAGIAALRQELPYLARGGRLDGLAGDYDKQIQGASGIIDVLETSLFDEGEQHAYTELREATINAGFLGDNARQLNEHLDYALRAPGGPAGKERVERLYRWQGLPEDSQVKGFIDLTAID